MNFFIGLVALFGSSTCLAVGLDSAQQDAMDKTTQMMISPSQFTEAAKENSDAQKAAVQLNAITADPAQQQKIRELSAGIFNDVAKSNECKDEKIMEALQKAQANPGDFLKSLTPEQQAKLRDLASEIEAKKK